MKNQKIRKHQITAKHGDFKKNNGNCKNYTRPVLVAGSRFELLISGSLGASEPL